MGELVLPIAVTAIVLAWLGVWFVVRHWGVGFTARSVHCPHKNLRATISTVNYTRNGWGVEVGRDVLQCSLAPGALTCDKSCLVQL